MKLNKKTLIACMNLLIYQQIAAANILVLFPDDVRLGQQYSDIAKRTGLVNLSDVTGAGGENVVKYSERLNHGNTITYYFKDSILHGITLSSPWENNHNRLNDIRNHLKDGSEYIDRIKSIRAASDATARPVMVERWSNSQSTVDYNILLIATSEELTVTLFDPKSLDLDAFLLNKDKYEQLKSTLETMRNRRSIKDMAEIKFIDFLVDIPEPSISDSVTRINESQKDAISDDLIKTGIQETQDNHNVVKSTDLTHNSPHKTLRLIFSGLVVLVIVIFLSHYLFKEKKFPVWLIFVTIAMLLYFSTVHAIQEYKQGHTIFISQPKSGVVSIRIREVPSFSSNLLIFSPLKEKFYVIEYAKSLEGSPTSARVYSMDSHTIKSAKVEWENNHNARVFIDERLVLILDNEWWHPSPNK
jgi:hypothetical protein